VFGDVLNPYLLGLLAEPESSVEHEALLRRIFGFHEWLARDDEMVQEVVSTTVVERLGADPDALAIGRRYTGPATRRVSDEIEVFWSARKSNNDAADPAATVASGARHDVVARRRSPAARRKPAAGVIAADAAPTAPTTASKERDPARRGACSHVANACSTGLGPGEEVGRKTSRQAAASTRLRAPGCLCTGRLSRTTTWSGRRRGPRRRAPTAAKAARSTAPGTSRRAL
jgi:hypothetical protein